MFGKSPVLSICYGLLLIAAAGTPALAADKSVKVAAMAWPLPEGSAEGLGMSAERLDYIGQFFESQVAKNVTAGYTILVARNGKLIYSRAVGMQDREQNIPMAMDTRFRIASMTKPVTSVAVLMLYEQAKLQLDDPVARYLPEFADQRVYTGADATGNIVTEAAKRPMTIRHLLTHTAGLGYGAGYDVKTPIAKLWASLGAGPPKSLAVLTAELAKLPLYFHPGDAWRYSYADDVLGRVVEVVSGLPFDRFVQTRILDPLQMTHTGFFVPESARGKLAKVYKHNKAGALEASEMGTLGAVGAPPLFISGGAGLISTAGDYLRFAQMLANGGSLDGQQILSPVTVQLMTSNQIPDDWQEKYWGPSSVGLGYGLGVAPQINAKLAPQANLDGDYSWGGVLDTHWIASPRTGLVAVLMCQINPSGETKPRNTDGEFRGLLFAAVKTLDAPTQKPAK